MYQAYKRMSKVMITDGFSDRAMLEQYFPWIATLFVSPSEPLRVFSV